MAHPPKRLRSTQAVRSILIATFLMLVLGSAWRTPFAHAATITVTTPDDELNSDGDCSLREAIRAANRDQPEDACAAGDGADTVVVPAGDFLLTIVGSNEDGSQTGDLDILEDLTIAGAGRAATTIDANNLDRVFDISTPVVNEVHISGMTLRGGTAVGGAFYVSDGNLTLTDVRLTDNPGSGSTVYFIGDVLTLRDSRVTNNPSKGLFINSTDAVVTIVDSVIAGNATTTNGGGISSSGTLTLINSTVSGNSAEGDGGGILSAGPTSLYNVTIAENTADADGDNSGDGGGISHSGADALLVQNSILGGNADASGAGVQEPDCAGTLTSVGYNLIEETTGCTIDGNIIGNLVGVSPNLGPLQPNGGGTLTHALLPGSPARDAGNPTGCLGPDGLVLPTDQRGFARAVDGGTGVARCDMGAYEFDSPGTPTPTLSPTPSNTPTPSRTPSATATRTASVTASPTATSTGTVNPTLTRTPTHTPPVTPSPSPTATGTATPGSSPTATNTATPGPSPTSTRTATATEGEDTLYTYLPLIQR